MCHSWPDHWPRPQQKLQLPKRLLPCVNFLSIHNFNKGKTSSVDSELTSPLQPSSRAQDPAGSLCLLHQQGLAQRHLLQTSHSQLPLNTPSSDEAGVWQGNKLGQTTPHVVSGDGSSPSQEVLRPPGAGLPSHPLPNSCSSSSGLSKPLSQAGPAFSDPAKGLRAGGSGVRTMMLRQMEKTQQTGSLQRVTTHRIPSCHPKATCSSGAGMT